MNGLNIDFPEERLDAQIPNGRNRSWLLLFMILMIIILLSSSCTPDANYYIATEVTEGIVYDKQLGFDEYSIYVSCNGAVYKLYTDNIIYAKYNVGDTLLLTHFKCTKRHVADKR